MFLATFGFTGMQVLIKELSNFHVFEIVFFRSAIPALFCIGLLKRQGISLIAKKTKIAYSSRHFWDYFYGIFFHHSSNIAIGGFRLF